MASSSSSSSSSSCIYEVFLNFRGEDTRRIFTCHLYDGFVWTKEKSTSISWMMKSSGEGDENFSDALLEAQSKFKNLRWVIFSKDCTLKQHFEEEARKVQRWRDALRETSGLAGHESTKFRHDAELVNKIVEDVLKKLEKITVSTDSSNGLVGLNSRIEQIKPFLCMDLWDTVQIVGIWGMGGIGKTTLAEAIFDQFSGEFDVEQLWEGEKACVPSSIQNFKYLSALSFEGCRSLSLIEFPQISGKITRLYLTETAIEEVPSSIECLTDLEVLDLRDCKRLKRISTRFCKLRSLVDLFLDGCLNLERFPEILEKMEHLKRISLGHTAITELPSSFENLPGLVVLFVEDCSKLDKLPDNIGNLESLRNIFAVGSAISELPSSVADSNVLRLLHFSRCKGLVSLPRSLLLGLSSLGDLRMSNCALMEIPQEIACLSSLKELFLSGNNFESLPTSIKQLSRLSSLYLDGCKMLQSLPELPFCLESLDLTDCKMLQSLPELPLCLKYLRLGDCNMLQSLPALPLGLETLDLEDCNMLRSLPELPLCLQLLNARNCNRLQSLPEIPLCLQELDASVLEKLSKPSPGLRRVGGLESQPIHFVFTNCLKLNGKANKKILADSLLIIRRMAIASLRRGYEKAINMKISALRGSLIVLPGSEIPDWFSDQSSGSSICIQLPPHSFCRNLIGFAFCAVLDFKQV
ncbi:hypothetical protein CUMW_268730, partial [Citrus unshiu]